MNGATLDFNAVKGFDIPADVATATANQVPAAGSAVAVLRVGSATAVYTISLQDGTAINFGTVGNGATTLRGLAVTGQPRFEDSRWLTTPPVNPPLCLRIHWVQGAALFGGRPLS